MNSPKFIPYAYEATGSDGRIYGLITLCTVEAKDQLQKVGLLPDDVRELVGMQTVVDTHIAMLERDMPGVVVQ